MEEAFVSRPIQLNRLNITDVFWKEKMELVRKEVIPYQWEALNDRLEHAAPSYCMHNFKAAGERIKRKRELVNGDTLPIRSTDTFCVWPEDGVVLRDHFYGYVFQDSDFGKWIEAVGYSLIQHYDPKLEQVADEAIETVCKAQQDDGYLNTFYIINDSSKRFTNLKDHHELYCFGHLAEGAVSYYQATGKDKLLHAVCRYADCMAAGIGSEAGKKRGYPGHEEAELALIRLYEVTGNSSCLELSRYFLEERGKKPYYFDEEQSITGEEGQLRYQYQQAHLPIRQQEEAVGHAVRAVYLYSAMADLARITQDDSLFEACNRLWNNMADQKMYITGGIGGTRYEEAFSYPYDLPNDTAYAETCAAIGLVFFARRMLEIKADAQYADIMERALYNGVLSGIALDGKSFFYVNPLEVNPPACKRDERISHVKPQRQAWFGCACCPPNLARIISSIGAYAYTESEDTLYLHLYLGGRIRKEIDGRRIDIDVESEFPWQGHVSISLKTDSPVRMRIALRIPGWCDAYKISGAEQIKSERKDGYLYLDHVWSDEKIIIDFPMKAKLIEADLQVRENVDKAAVVRGPVVYCLEGADNGEQLHLIHVDEQLQLEERDGLIQNEAVVLLKGSGWRRRAVLKEKEGLYHSVKKAEYDRINLTWIPYYTWANRIEGELQVWIRMYRSGKGE